MVAEFKESSRIKREEMRLQYEMEMKKLELKEAAKTKEADRKHAPEMERVRMEMMMQMVRAGQGSGNVSSGLNSAVPSLPTTPLLIDGYLDQNTAIPIANLNNFNGYGAGHGNGALDGYDFGGNMSGAAP